MINKLFEICVERNSDSTDQRRRVLEQIERGTDVSAADKNGVTALHHAVRFRSVAAVEALIESGADVNQACRRNESTPLHRAVTQTGAPGTAGKAAATEEIIKLLLKAGADPRIENKSGKAPIDYVNDNELEELLALSTGNAQPASPKSVP